VDILSLGMPVRHSDGRIVSFVAPAPQENYDCVLISDRIELFEHSWTYAFLDRCNTLARPGGAIILPACRDSTSNSPHGTSHALFGSGPEETSRTYLTFRKVPNCLNRPSGARHSTLDAYWPLMETLIYSRFDPSIGKTISALGVEPQPRGVPRKPTYLVCCTVRLTAHAVPAPKPRSRSISSHTIFPVAPIFAWRISALERA